MPKRANKNFNTSIIRLKEVGFKLIVTQNQTQYALTTHHNEIFSMSILA